MASLTKGTQSIYDHGPPTAGGNGKGTLIIPGAQPRIRGPPAPYVGKFGQKGTRDRSPARGKGKGSLAPKGASEIGSTFGPPSDDWTLVPRSPAIEAIPEIEDILSRSQPQWFPDSRPEGYKIRVGDLPPDLDTQDLITQLLEDIQETANYIKEDTRGDIDLGDVIRPSEGGFAETEIRMVDIKRDRTATGAAYATITCQSIRVAILAAVGIWRNWTSTMWENTAWYNPTPTRRWKVSLRFLMERSATQDTFFGADTARTAAPRDPRYRTAYRAAADLVNQGAGTFMNPATYPGGAAAAAAAQDIDEDMEEETGLQDSRGWLGPDTDDEFDTGNQQPVRGAPWQTGPLAP